MRRVEKRGRMDSLGATTNGRDTAATTYAREGSVTGGSLSHHRIITLRSLSRNKRDDGRNARRHAILRRGAESGNRRVLPGATRFIIHAARRLRVPLTVKLSSTILKKHDALARVVYRMGVVRREHGYAAHGSFATRSGPIRRQGVML